MQRKYNLTENTVDKFFTLGISPQMQDTFTKLTFILN